MTKKQLIRSLSDALIARNYTVVVGSTPGAAAVHMKIWNGLRLLVSLEFSHHRKDWFSGSLFLSKTTCFAYLLPGFPAQAYRRIGEFLTRSERHDLLDKEFHHTGIVDAWWVGFTDATCKSFITSHDLAVPRFLSQPQLIDQINGCKELTKHMDMVEETIRYAKRPTERRESLEFQPSKPKLRIAAPWFHGAELAIRHREPRLISTDYVELLAIDAWRSHNG